MKRILILLVLLYLLPLAAEDKAGLKPGFHERYFKHGGRQRNYLLYLPKAYAENKALPMLILLHGGGGNAAQAIDSYRMAEKAEKANFILLAPNGNGFFPRRLLTWNVGFGFGYAEKKNIDDVSFLGALIESLKKELKIDSRRIYATGISNGGIMCHWLAAMHGDKIAAIAPVVGTIGGKKIGGKKFIVPPNPKIPVSVIIFQGEKDDHVPYKGGMQRKSVSKPREMMSTEQTVVFWLKANGIKETPRVEKNKAKQYSKTTYSGGKNGTEVELYTIHNQGHAWPGGKKPRWLADQPTTLISANDIMWEFFMAHPKATNLPSEKRSP